jgi:tetratricopeptide (TPR) repeat protein
LDFADYYVGESQLNGLGYTYLGKEQLAEALAIFKLNVELFPASGNTHDSLGEALLASGDKAAALAAYRQSLLLDPTNENAAKVIAELTAPPPEE